MSSRDERLLNLTQRAMAHAVDSGVIRLQTEDERFEGPVMTVEGSRLLDFGSCSYLGLNRHERLKAGAHDAVDRYGPNYSSSIVYTALGLYGELEERLRLIFDTPALVAPTTTLAHLGALPVLALQGDLVLLDQNAHATLHLTADVLRGRGVRVDTVPHNDPAALRDMLVETADEYNKIWFVADGLYSMLGDFAPIRQVAPLLDEFPNLHVYYDEAHSVGWKGLHGRGHVLDEVPMHPRMVIAAGLAKSFGAHGAVLAFGTEEMRERVLFTGSSFTFSGPIQVASLGAAIASADMHLAPEHATRQALLDSQITLMRSLLRERKLPVLGLDHQSPIWYVKVGRTKDAVTTARQLMDDGYYVNPAAYPAMPLGSAGIRFTQTLHHSERDLRNLVDALANRIPPIEPEIVVDLRAVEREAEEIFATTDA